MPKILVNYKLTGEEAKFPDRGQTFPLVELKQYGTVFADMGKKGGICVVDMDTTYAEPCLVFAPNEFPMAVEKAELFDFIAQDNQVSTHYKLIIGEHGEIREATAIDSPTKIFFWRGPKEKPDFSQLRFMNGQIVWIKPTEELKSEKEEDK